MADLFDFISKSMKDIGGLAGSDSAGGDLVSFFQGGGVFLFDENDAGSESTYYRVEDLMGESQGESITETETGDDDTLCLFYDSSVMDDETAREKYKSGNYVKSI